eukprot:TRINITY_DN357_c5_g1_i1.p1 TRINITY_DN357_c5_g1~~TRINITY_DN357_c5_g1_i1.p1  ORF type:complete len:209 (-),score=44.57 TRINITY_DN357_c5_g1_i1:202-828(-)
MSVVRMELCYLLSYSRSLLLFTLDNQMLNTPTTNKLFNSNFYRLSLLSNLQPYKMQAAMSVTRVAVPIKIQARPARASSVVVAGLREDATRYVQAAGLAAASFSLALSASAVTIKMGGDDGSLVFDPASVTVKAGDEVTWVNNKGFPHNVVFDEDEVPSGVDADALSHEDYFNAPGESYSVKLSTTGTYSYNCEPHQGAGMAGKITVQ